MGQGVLDIEALLAPLATGDGAGEDIRSDFTPQSLYQRIRTQRNDARAGERAIDGGDPEANPVTVAAAWQSVKKIGIECLATKTKDYEVAAWMVEALVRIDGLNGLADGADLIGGLCRDFWDKGFPGLDGEYGLEDRGAPIGGLSGEGADGTVMAPLRKATLFHRADGSDCDLFTWQQAIEVSLITEKARREQRLKAGVPEFEGLQNEARADVGTLREVGIRARAALAAWQGMSAVIDERFGAEAPSTRRVAEVLQEIIEVSTKIAGAPPEPAAEGAGEGAGEAAADGAEGEMAGAGGAGPAGPPRPARTREDAIRQLEMIAEFFRKTEPHSPIAFTLDDAVRRARMPLPDLLAEVLPDAAARGRMLTMLGIRVQEGGGG